MANRKKDADQDARIHKMNVNGFSRGTISEIEGMTKKAVTYAIMRHDYYLDNLRVKPKQIKFVYLMAETMPDEMLFQELVEERSYPWAIIPRNNKLYAYM